MATLQDVARQRKAQLKQLMLASRKLDASQEALEREVKRLINRKGSVPEVADASRLIAMAKGVESSLSNMVSLLSSLASSWGTV